MCRDAPNTRSKQAAMGTPHDHANPNVDSLVAEGQRAALLALMHGLRARQEDKDYMRSHRVEVCRSEPAGTKKQDRVPELLLEQQEQPRQLQGSRDAFSSYNRSRRLTLVA